MEFSPRVRQLLLLAIASIGVGAAWISWLQDSAIGTMLFMNYEVPQRDVRLVLNTLASLLIIAVVTLFFKTMRVYGAGFIFLYLCILTFAVIDQGGHPFSDYTFAAYAMRIAAPLAFIIVYTRNFQSLFADLKGQIAMWIMIGATCATFFMHGLEAIWAHPWFVDMTITMASNLARWSISQTLAENMLIVVGILDIVSALGLLFFKSKIAAVWMCIWGFFTCLLRVVNYGLGGLPDAIIRLPHGLLPLALYFIFDQKKGID